MANTTIGIGIALIVLGLGGYLGSGAASPTALIPAAFGLLLVIFGAMARNEARRKVAMHIAVVVGLLGFLGSVSGLAGLAQMLSGAEVARPMAVISRSVMAVLTGVFVALCIKSFIDVRRNRS